MSKIMLNVEELTTALEDHGEMHQWYLDKQTGEIVMVADGDYGDVCPEDEEMSELIDNEPDRFVLIEPLDSNDSFRVMEDFVEGLKEGEAQRTLARALRMRGPFRAFKDTLCEFPDLRQQWFKFNNEWLSEQARIWLEQEGVDAELVESREDKENDDR